MAAYQATQQAPNKRFRMFETAESASLWFDIFNGILLLGAFLVLVGTWGTIRTAAVKERFSDERTAANEAETKRAVADSDAAKEGTAKANERIAELSTQAEQLRKVTAEANARAAEANLALERFRAPRSLNNEQKTQIATLLKSFAGQQYSGMVAGSVPDARSLWVILDKVLTAANWIRQPPWGLAAGDPPAGVPVSPSDGVTLFVPVADLPELLPAVKTLASTLIAAGIATAIAADSGPQTRPKIIVIEVGTKPQ